jgi:hypothetical protein
MTLSFLLNAYAIGRKRLGRLHDLAAHVLGERKVDLIGQIAVAASM